MKEAAPPALLVRNLSRQTVTASVCMVHGAAHDPGNLAGATHLVEHLTLRRCGNHDRASLARLVDRLGGDVDAWTGLELMGVTVQTTVDALDQALELLSDAVLTPTFDPGDVELEQRVALAELDLVNDDPVEQVEEALLSAAWGDHPLARPVIGTAESLTRLEPEGLSRHHAAMLRPGGLVATVCGDVDPGQVAAGFSRLGLDRSPAPPPLPPLKWHGKHLRVSRPGIDQGHGRLAFKAVPLSDPAVPALAILNRVLGVGASSRLFQRLREEEGLTYDIGSSLMLRSAGGLLEIGWACAPDVFSQVWQLICQELAGLANGVGDEEVAVAKEAMIRGLRMESESTSGLCSMDLAEVLDHDRRFDLEVSIREIQEVVPERVNQLARNLDTKAMASAVCGPEGLAAPVS